MGPAGGRPAVAAAAGPAVAAARARSRAAAAARRWVRVVRVGVRVPVIVPSPFAEVP